MHLFHGFFGTSEDWFRSNWFSKAKEMFFPEFDVQTYNYLSDDSIVGMSLGDFAKHLSVSQIQDGDILIGYSMGGRLALEVASLSERQLRGCILLSTQLISPVSNIDR